MARLGDVAPKLPVVEKEKVKNPFHIDAAPSTFRGRYGESWRVPCVDVKTGERFLMLFAGNDVRNHDMESIQTYFGSGNTDPIGPLTLAKSMLESGRETWELVDADG